MTVSDTPASAAPQAAPSAPGCAAPAPAADRARAWRAFGWTMFGVVVLFGLLQNRYWVPAGDSEVYISIARNLANGDGYTFNGERVAMVPPGWPALMAAVMTVAPYFLVLKLLAMSCMVGALAAAFWICVRFVSPTKAAGVVLLTAILSPVHQATFWLTTEGSFCLISTVALLLAFQLKEGRAAWWRVALLAVLCIAAVLVRWAGVLGMMLVVAVLIDGELMPRLNRRWLAAGLCCVLSVGTFFALRQRLKAAPGQPAASEIASTTDVIVAEASPTPTPTLPTALTQAASSPGVGDRVAKPYKLIASPTGASGYLKRGLRWGRWLGTLYCQPFRAAAGSGVIEGIGNAFGWLLLLLLFVPAACGVARRHWLWLALLLYCAIMAMNWPSPNARYLVPVAFLLTLGIVLAEQQWRAAPWGRGSRAALRGVLVASGVGVLACNVALWAVEVGVARSGDFYAAYEAGTNQHLIAAARYLNRLDLGDGEIAVSPAYDNLNERHASPFGLRATTMLTGRAVVSLPRPWHRHTINARLGRWLAKESIRYYIHQVPLSPWRAWHFRVGWWQERRTAKPLEPAGPQWELWRIDPSGRMVRIELKPSSGWPTRVPGLERADKRDRGVPAAQDVAEAGE